MPVVDLEKLIAEQRARIDDLLVANTRYQQEARDARYALTKAQVTIDALAAQNVHLQQSLTTQESELRRGTQ